MSKRFVMLFAVLFALGTSLVACSGGGGAEKPADTAVPPVVEPTVAVEPTAEMPAATVESSTSAMTETTTMTQTSMVTETTGMTESSSAASGENNVTVVTKDAFAFAPAAVSAAAGAEMYITLDNSAGALDHSWVVTKKGVTKDQAVTIVPGDETMTQFVLEVKAGQKAKGDFKAPTEPGEYLIVCHVAGHAAGGMTGTLTVK